ncbi:MAG: CinA family nicotinamide mononucleotide deamidase-related protein [Bacteroidales bacterium]|nr:CinA family nicotinamide mononucleotide deamidase-related protein [Bacteroidales bacterium]
MVTATICTIGDEILIGQIVDTNSSKISTALNSIGVKVVSMVSTSDTEEDIINTVENALKTSNVVVITGGLGPTKDDITKKTLGKLTGATADVENQEQLEIITRILSARGMVPLSPLNRGQAMVPNSCKVIPNQFGTAPCMEFELPAEKYGHKAVMYSLPGVPFEAEAAIPKVLESIQGHFQLNRIFHRTICTFGIPESTLAQQIEEWEDNLPDNIHLAYLPNPILGVRLRLSIYGVDEATGLQELAENEAKLREMLGDAIYGEGTDSMQKVIGKTLKERGMTVGVAESCTGGFLASLFTSQPGASEYFYGGVISYDNSVKMNVLGVEKEVLEKYGAVSQECAEQMAAGARRVLGTDYAIATTGIAGPDGGTPEKPAGTVWIAVASPEGVTSKKFTFNSTRRNINIERFAANALNMLRLQLIK